MNICDANPDKIATIIGIIISIVLTISNFLQWSDIKTYGFKTSVRNWAKMLFIICTILLIVSLGLV